MKTLRSLFPLLASVLLVLPSALLAQTNSYIVGTMFPMSGANAEAGGIYTNAAQLAFQHIAEDKWLKRPIDVRPTDSQGTPQGGAVGMTRLVNVEKVVYALVGFTGVSKAAAPIGDRGQVMMVNGGAVGPDLAALSRFFWNIIPLANQEVVTLLPWLQSEGLTRIAVIYVDDPLGQGILKELRNGLPRHGGGVVAAYSVAPDAQQFSAIAAKLRDDRPDAIYFASPNITQMTHIIKQLRDGGIKQRLITYGAANFPSVTKLPESEGLVFTSQAADWNSQQPAMKRFVEGWRAKYKAEPTTYGLNYYNAALLFGHLARGLEKANKPVTGEMLIEELQRIQTFELAGGKYAFSQGTVTTAIQINRIRNGATEKIQ